MKKVDEYGDYAEQDYFNWLMKYKMWRISFYYNAMHYQFLKDLDLWNRELKPYHKVIHFTWLKPIEGKTNELIKLWTRFQNETNQNYHSEKCLY